MTFNDAELAYLRSQDLARIATLDTGGQPDLVPVAFEFDGTFIWVGGSGASVLDTRKFRNVRAGGQKIALVIDMVSFDPFVARGVRVYGTAEEPFERVGMMAGPGFYMRITPVVSWSWDMAGEPVGEAWYESRRADHAIPH